MPGDELPTLRGHSGVVYCAVFSPDGSRIASAGEDKTARVWDAFTGQQLMTLRGHSDRVYSSRFSPDGRRIVTDGQGGGPTMWDARTGMRLFNLAADEDVIERLIFSPNGKVVFGFGDDGVGQFFDAASGKSGAIFSLLFNSGRSAAYSPDRNGLAVGSNATNGGVIVFDSASQQTVKKLQVDSAQGIFTNVSGVAFSPDGKRLAATSNDEVIVWDATIWQRLLTLRGYSGGLSSITFSPDGQKLAVGRGDSTTVVWDAFNGRELLSLYGHSAPVTSVAFSSDGRRLATASEDDSPHLHFGCLGPP